MITQLDNTLTPLIERCKNALGYAPIVSIDYLDKDHVQVRLHQGDIQVTAHYNSLFEGINNQFDNFISMALEEFRLRHQYSDYGLRARPLCDIQEELDEIDTAINRPVYQREWTGGVNVQPARFDTSVFTLPY